MSGLIADITKLLAHDSPRQISFSAQRQKPPGIPRTGKVGQLAPTGLKANEVQPQTTNIGHMLEVPDSDEQKTLCNKEPQEHFFMKTLLSKSGD